MILTATGLAETMLFSWGQLFSSLTFISSFKMHILVKHMVSLFKLFNGRHGTKVVEKYYILRWLGLPCFPLSTAPLSYYSLLKAALLIY